MPEIDNSLPGHELITAGLEDLRHGHETINSLLVSVGASKLRSLGFEVPQLSLTTWPEHRLYEVLAAEDEDSAHSRYNALIRRLVSFERAVACISQSPGRE